MRLSVIAVVLATSASATAFADPPTTESVVAAAFGGHAPELPLLSADGKLAAVDASVGLGMSSIVSYEVAVLDAKSVVDRLVVVDLALAKSIDAGSMTGPTAAVRAAAAMVSKRLASFTPFATDLSLDAIRTATGPLPLGASASLAVEHSDKTGLRLRLLDSNGAELHAVTIPVRPREFSNRDGGRCGGTPTLVHLWWDEPRHRALAEIVFPGHDSCQDEPRAWLML